MPTFFRFSCSQRLPLQSIPLGLLGVCCPKTPKFPLLTPSAVYKQHVSWTLGRMRHKLKFGIHDPVSPTQFQAQLFCRKAYHHYSQQTRSFRFIRLFFLDHRRAKGGQKRIIERRKISVGLRFIVLLPTNLRLSRTAEPLKKSS